MVAGEHLMRMSVNGFRYMHDAVEKGDIKLGYDIPEVSPFKRDAKPISA